MRSWLPLLLAVLGLASPPGIEPAEYASRRERLGKAIGPDAMLVVLPRTPSLRSGDTDYPFRQSDALLYLSGIEQAETGLVLLPGEARVKEAIFVADADPVREVWTGRVLTREEARKASGVEHVLSAGRLRSFVSAAIEGRPWGESPLPGYYRPPGMPAYRRAVTEGRAQVWLLLSDRRGLSEPPTAEQQLAADLRRAYPEIHVRDASPILDAMREVKSAAELRHIQRAIDVTALAIRAGMRRTLTATHEYQVEAAIEHVFRDEGACCPAFPSIVGAGRNATVLHYESNNDPIPRDGLVLTDVGAEVGGYSADVTRTFPADGTFSPAQRAIYEAVLASQTEASLVTRPGRMLSDMHARAQEVLGGALLKLGLITANDPAQVQMYLRHGAGHPLGLAVHDVFDRTRALEAGMVVTIEPGVYVREADVRASPAYAKLSDADRAKIDAALAQYAGIGVRIEDDYAITNDGAQLLSGGAPRTVAEIEAWMAGGARK
jgi:Xaa-Pro aminopeptidase